MTVYLTIITTALVLTQIIRLIQNAMQLNKQNKLIKNQLKDVEDITTFDIHRQRRMHDLLIAYLERKEADAAPVVRGKWMQHYEETSDNETMAYGWDCSLCGRWEIEQQLYCNCGARMGGEL